MYGTYETIDGKPAVRFERVYPHPVEHVWRSVTEPAELARWFPTTVEVDLREGGAMAFTFPEGEMEPMDGSVVELDPPHRFAFLWGSELLRFELAAEGEGCRLTLTHVISSADEAARNAAGWHVCLDKLGGAETEWEPYYEEYRRRGMPAGAPVPGAARG
jgi:uncharacterized protein YndB with AHSA1/START domain